MKPSLREIVESYDAAAPLAEAWTIPAPWYVDERVYELERRTVFARSWQLVARAEQVREAGQYVTAEVAGEPLAGRARGRRPLARLLQRVPPPRRGRDDRSGRERALAAVPVPRLDVHARRRAEGHAGLRGRVRVRARVERAGGGRVRRVGELGLRQSRARAGRRSRSFSGRNSSSRCARSAFGNFTGWSGAVTSSSATGRCSSITTSTAATTCRTCTRGWTACSIIREYTIENGGRFCLQSSPVVSAGAEAETGAVRTGERALYYWVYPNFMVNWYEGVMDTNLVRPLGVDQDGGHLRLLLRGRVGRGARAQPGEHRRRPADTGRGHGHLQVGAARASDRAPTRRGASPCGARRASTSSTNSRSKTLERAADFSE